MRSLIMTRRGFLAASGAAVLAQTSRLAVADTVPRASLIPEAAWRQFANLAGSGLLGTLRWSQVSMPPCGALSHTAWISTFAEAILPVTAALPIAPPGSVSCAGMRAAAASCPSLFTCEFRFSGGSVLLVQCTAGTTAYSALIRGTEATLELHEGRLLLHRPGSAAPEAIRPVPAPLHAADQGGAACAHRLAQVALKDFQRAAPFRK